MDNHPLLLDGGKSSRSLMEAHRCMRLAGQVFAAVIPGHQTAGVPSRAPIECRKPFLPTHSIRVVFLREHESMRTGIFCAF